MENYNKQNFINAIKESIKMWEYIQNNGCCDKVDYFIDNNIKCLPVNTCYLCDTLKENCFYCINWNKENSNDRVNCCNIKSPFYRYIKGFSSAYKIAPEMVKVLNRELKRFTNE